MFEGGGGAQQKTLGCTEVTLTCHQAIKGWVRERLAIEDIYHLSDFGEPDIWAQRYLAMTDILLFQVACT